MNKVIVYCLIIIFSIYLVICGVLFFIQESLLFYPTKISLDYAFKFSNDFEEITIETEDGIRLNNLLFLSKEKKGVVLFFHGNAGALNGWGTGASLYVENGYDVFYTDYRGFGKSEGEIYSEKQLIQDAQLVYDFVKSKYGEEQLIIEGISLGTGIATQMAANNNPKSLVLSAPYSSLKHLILEKMPFILPFLIKYKLNSIKYLAKVNCSITLFHGEQDDLIPHQHSVRLKEKFEKIDLNLIPNRGHNDVFLSKSYQEKMNEILK